MGFLIDQSVYIDHSWKRPHLFQRDLMNAIGFYHNTGSAASLHMGKTSNGWITTNQNNPIEGTDICRKFSAWHERSTPGLVKNIVHLAWLNGTVGEVHYAQINMTDFSVSAIKTVATPTSGIGADAYKGMEISITVARNGNILIQYWANATDAGDDHGLFRATDGTGDAWTSLTSGADAGTAVDKIIMVPGDFADKADILMMYWDFSADEISIKVYDDSLNSWSEGTDASMANHVESTFTYCAWDATVNHATGKIILAAVDAPSNGTHRVWLIGGTADIVEVAGSPLIINGNINAIVGGVIYNLLDGSWAVTYTGSQLGGNPEISSTTMSAYYKRTTDDGATFEQERKVGGLNDDYDAMGAVPFIGPWGGSWMVAIYNDDTGDMEWADDSRFLPGSYGGKSEYLAQAILDEIFENTALAELANVYVGLFNAMPYAGVGGTEASGTDYARKSTAVTDWSRSGRTISNDNDVALPDVGAGAWGNILGFGIWDALTNGNLLYYGWFLDPFASQQGDTISFISGNLTVTEA